MQGVRYYRMDLVQRLYEPIQDNLSLQTTLFKSDRNYLYYGYFAEMRKPSL